MNNIEKTINTKRVFDGKIINLRVDEVLLPNGRKSTREIVEHRGGVGIVAVVDKKIILVKQFRKPLEESILEIPAGKLEANEDPYECAIREMEEETGFVPQSLKLLTCIYTTPGFTNEKLYIYFTDDLKKGTVNMDEDEIIDIEYYELPEILHMINTGLIKDAKTICGVLMYKTMIV